MAKIASSKPYGSGNKSKMNTPTKKESEVISPVRTSPRRKKTVIEEQTQKEELAEKQPVEKPVKKTKKPVAPKFNESKKKSESKSPKTTRGRRKSLIEPEPVVIAPSEPMDPEEPEEDFDYVESVQSSSIYNSEQEQEEYEQEDEQNYHENSPIFEQEIIEDEVQEEQNDYTEYPEYNEQEEGDFEEYVTDVSEIAEEYNEQFKYTSETVKARLAQYFNRQETASSNPTVSLTSSISRSQMWNKMKNWISDNLLVGARELGGVTIEYTKRAIEEITKRLETKPVDHGDYQEEVEMEEEPRIYEIIDDDNEEEEETETFEEYKRQKLMDFEQNEPTGYESSSFHSLPEHTEYTEQADQDVTVILPSVIEEEIVTPAPAPVISSESFIIKSDVMESRLTELVLFFAKCTNDTPLPTIYEHLEEFFTLKGENALNFTEKQLVSTVIKEYLTEKPESAFESVMNTMSTMGTVNTNVNSMSSFGLDNLSPKRIKVLPGSGIRFRAPKFTAEEEARLEEMEQTRQKNLAASNASRMTTPSQRNKLQKKLLAPEMTSEDLEGMPASKGRISVSKKDKEREKDDSVNAAIEDIISQKIRESKQREEAERIETEKLKARVAELERESRDRATKEALLKKQLEEQKKELEIERQAAKEKIEKIKAEKPKESKVVAATGPSLNFRAPSGSISEEKPPFSEATGGFKPFSFGGAKAEEKKNSGESSSLNPSAPAFKPFEFSAKKESEVKTETAGKLSGFGFSFGAKVEEHPSNKIDESVKPAFNFKTEESKPAFNFGSETPKSPIAFGEDSGKNAFSFGAGKTEEKKEEAGKSGFTFGVVKGEDSKPSFSFGAKTEETKPAFNFGTTKTEDNKSTFSFGASKTEEPTKSAFNFGSSTKSEETKSAFNFGPSTKGDESKPFSSSSGFNVTPSTSTPSAFNFGSSFPIAPSTSTSNTQNTSSTTSTSQSNTFGFGSSSYNFGSSTSNPFSSTASANNPFAALNSATNIFNSGAPVSFGSSNITLNSNPNINNNNNNNIFSFPSLQQPAAPGGIIPMNFGSPSNPSMETSEGGFQTGRSISVPKRRMLRK